MQPTRRQRLEVALEELRNNGSGAEKVFEWFGERDAQRTEALKLLSELDAETPSFLYLTFLAPHTELARDTSC